MKIDIIRSSESASKIPGVRQGDVLSHPLLMLYNIYSVSGFTADLHTASPQLRPTLLNAFTMKI